MLRVLLAACLVAAGCALPGCALYWPVATQTSVDYSPAPVGAVSLRAHVARLPTSRAAGSVGLVEAQSLVLRQLVDYGYDVRLEPVPEAGDNAANVVAELIGRDPGIVLVGAHYDAVDSSPGADDNASGVAVAIEIARRLSSVTPRRTIRFVFFTHEELGLLGSRQHAASADDVIAMINLEMVGYFTDKPDSQTLPPIPGLDDVPTVGDFLGVVANTASKNLAATLDANLREAGMKTYVLDFIPGNGRLAPDVRRSDHAPFWDAGVPAVMLTDTSNFRNPHYHTPGDTIDTLDFNRMAQVARGVEAAVRELAGVKDERF